VKNPWKYVSAVPRINAEKAHAFAKHLEQAYQPHLLENAPDEEDLIQLLETPYQLKPPQMN
jgi:hypothetical protein